VLRKIILISSMTLCAFAADFKVKGFVALDLLNLEKVEGQEGSIGLGYGTADVKVYFNQEDFSAKIKLDIDGSTDLMEEVLVMYRFDENYKMTFGKGKIRFHQMHYGISDITYTDGGYMINTSHSFRDQDRKYLANLEIGRRKNGYYQNITFFGNSQSIKRDRDDASKPYLSSNSGTIEYTQEKTFNSKYERGLAYQFNLTPDYETQYSIAALYYWRDIDPDADWAFDLAYNKNTESFEVWFEYVFAYTSKHPNDKYTSKKQYDNLIQLGYLYRLTDKLATGINLEASFVRKQHHDKNNYDSSTSGYGQSKYNDGETSKFYSYKANPGFQYKLAQRAQLNYGLIFERQYRNVTGKTDLEYYNAYGANLSASFWF